MHRIKRIKANIRFQPVRYGMVLFLLFSDNISSREQEIYSENKRKRTIPYHTVPYRLKLSGVDIHLKKEETDEEK